MLYYTTSNKIKIHLVPLAKLLALVLLAFLVLQIGVPKAAAQSAGPIGGYAWSDNIGWISLSGANYGLSVASDGTISGYAWSDNIGWVSANESGCPSGLCTPRLQSGVLTGWLKAIAGGTAGSGGWDGWISLSGSGYGVTQSGTNFSGFAWGSDVVGWTDFSYASYTPPPPTITIIRNTYTLSQGQSLTTEVSTMNATSLSFLCTGSPGPGINSVYTYPSQSGPDPIFWQRASDPPVSWDTIYTDWGWRGSYECTWTATGSGGTTVHQQPTFTIIPPGGIPWGANVTQPANCTISAGASTCPINFSWTSSGLLNQDFAACGFVNQNFGLPCGSSPQDPYTSSSNPNSNITYNVSGNGIYTRLAGTPPDGSSYRALREVQAKGVCAQGSAWNGSICYVPPISVNLTASPPGPLTAPGATTLTWTTTGNPDSCTASNYWSGAKTASGGSEPRSGIPVSTQIFDITCSKAGTADATSRATVVVNAPSTPTGYVTPNSCTIASGGSSCAMNVVWGSSNTTGTVTVQRAYDNNSIFATGPSGSTPATFTPPATYHLDLYDGTTKLGTGGNFTASCATGSTWNASSNKCVGNATVGTISASPNPCTVAIGASTCSTNLTWNINAPNPNVYSSYTGGNIYTSAIGNSQLATVTHNGTTFSARNSNSVLDSVTVTGTCVSGSAWNGGICATTTNPSCSVLNVNPTSISAGGTVALTWTCQNASSCTQIANTDGFSTGGGLSGTDNSVNPSIANGQVTYGITCDGTPFYFPPVTVGSSGSGSADISASPSRVNAGDTSQISWIVGQASGCSITKNGAAWRSGISSSGSATEAITDQTTYVLTCPSLPPSSITVNVAPDFEEF